MFAWAASIHTCSAGNTPWLLRRMRSSNWDGGVGARALNSRIVTTADCVGATAQKRITPVNTIEIVNLTRLEGTIRTSSTTSQITETDARAIDAIH